MQKIIDIYSPLLGSMLNIEKVPDLVFAEKMVGDGIAIEPFDNQIYAPISGVVKQIHKSKHAITISNEDGINVLTHIGLDSVNLNGNGFKLDISVGDKVICRQKIGEIDLDYISQHAKSLISPVIFIDLDPNVANFKVIWQEEAVLDQPVMQVTLVKKNTKKIPSLDTAYANLIKSAPIRITSASGIHARPAAMLCDKVKEIADGQVYMEKGERVENLKSIVAILGLSVECNDVVHIYAESQVVVDQVSRVLLELDQNDITELSDIEDANMLHRMKSIDGKYYGIIASTGIAYGKLVKKHTLNFQLSETATDSLKEKENFFIALSKVKETIRLSLDTGRLLPLAHQEILKAHLSLLDDPQIIEETLACIEKQKTAAFALFKVIEKHCTVLANSGNTLLNERQADLKDIRNKILNALGVDVSNEANEINEPSILIADEFIPADIMNIQSNIVGLVSATGGITSHVAILAKSYGIPLLVGVDAKLLSLDDNTLGKTILNAKEGYLNVWPTPNELEEVKNDLLLIRQQKSHNLSTSHKPAITQDGVVIDCLGNIDSVESVHNLAVNGGEGVGLFRSEFIFLGRERLPMVDEQLAVYRQILNQLKDNEPFVVRTLDIGGDKKIDYLEQAPEINPMLGVRGIRLCLQHKLLLVDQLEAILRLGKANVKIMLPMVSDINEYREVKQIVWQIKRKLNITTHIELGIMVEVPSVALLSGVFAKEVDFFSIGTNDLTQYILAIDREHTSMANKVDHLHPAVIHALELIVSGARLHNKPVSVCGLMATEKIALPVLIGLGITSLSMSIDSIPENKAFIRNLNYEHCRQVAAKCLTFATSEEVRKYLAYEFSN